MARSIYVNGETLVEVKGGVHLSGGPIGVLSELGLAEGQIAITPQINFRDVYVNDFGPDVPADVLTMLSSVKISMTLVNYDSHVLNICMDESMGGFGRQEAAVPPEISVGGTFSWYGGAMPGAGTPLGGLKRIFDSGWHYISLNLTIGDENFTGDQWTFPKCYLSKMPVEIPIGNEYSKVKLEWTAIPYYDPYQSGNGGIAGTSITGLPPYPNQTTDLITFTLRGDTPSSGAILWTRLRDAETTLVPMN